MKQYRIGIFTRDYDKAKRLMDEIAEKNKDKISRYVDYDGFIHELYLIVQDGENQYYYKWINPDNRARRIRINHIAYVDTNLEKEVIEEYVYSKLWIPISEIIWI